jgi:hypothetical protein
VGMANYYESIVTIVFLLRQYKWINPFHSIPFLPFIPFVHSILILTSEGTTFPFDLFDTHFLQYEAKIWHVKFRAFFTRIKRCRLSFKLLRSVEIMGTPHAHSALR